MCLGHPLLEDPAPAAIGNYVAIIPDFNQDIYNRVQKSWKKLISMVMPTLILNSIIGITLTNCLKLTSEPAGAVSLSL